MRLEGVIHICPNCQPHLFTKTRDGLEHLSPRFHCCPRWQVASDDKVYSNVYEAKAGERGFVWYETDNPCVCGSGYRDMGLASGKVECYHEKHLRKVVFDDGSYDVIVCPEQHLGPYSLYEAPSEPPALEVLGQVLEDLNKTLEGMKENPEE